MAARMGGASTAGATPRILQHSDSKLLEIPNIPRHARKSCRLEIAEIDDPERKARRDV
jgi:hypothetical protein